MAVAISASDTTGAHTASPTTGNLYTGLTVNSGDTDLCIFVTWGGTNLGVMSAFAVHWDSAGTNQLMTAVATPIASTDVQTLSGLWYLANPTSGNKTAKIDWTVGAGSPTDLYVTGMTFTGGGSSNNGNTATGSTSTPTITITSSSTNNYCVATLNENQTASVTANQGSLFCLNTSGTNGIMAAMDRVAGASSTVLAINAAGAVWSAIGAQIVAGVGAAAATPTPPFPTSRTPIVIFFDMRSVPKRRWRKNGRLWLRG